MAKIILGKVAISWKGPWQGGSTQYHEQDVVSYNNQCYICTSDAITPGTVPPANPTVSSNFWELFTSSPIDFSLNEFDLIFKDDDGNLSVLPLGADDSVLGIDYFTKAPTWQKLQFQLGSRIQRFATESNHDAIESTCFAIDTNNRLRAWGNGSNYALGIGSVGANEMLPVHVAFPQNFSGISKFYPSNATYHGAIDNDGKWWIWGAMASSNQGSPGSSIISDIFTPRCLSDEAGNSIQGKTIVSSVEKYEESSDYYSNILLDSNGHIHFVGYSDPATFGTSQATYQNYTIISSLNIPVATQITSSGHHQNATYYALDASGQVFSFGYQDPSVGERGGVSSTTSATQLSTITPAVKKIDASLGQGYAIDVNDGLWVWGKNTNGQLGLGNIINRTTPTVVSLFDGTSPAKKISNIYYNTGSQYRVTIVTSQDDKTYYSGNDFGNTTNTPQFTEIVPLSGKVVTHVACVGGNGSTNTITALFLTSANELYIIGYGGKGQLGNGKEGASNVFTSAQVFDRIGSGIRIVDIHGFGHNENSGFCLLDENGRLFYMGAGTNMKSSDDDSFDKLTLQEIVF